MPTGIRAQLYRARRVVQRLRAHVLFRGCTRGARLHAAQGMRVQADGDVVIGDGVYFLDGMIPSEVLCHAGGALAIGDATGFNYGVSLEAYERVVIGRRCMFGSMSRVCDRSGNRTAAIVLGDDIWIGHGATIEPGVTIGDGSVISAGSVVTTDVPAHSMAIGNPARALRLDLVAKR